MASSPRRPRPQEDPKQAALRQGVTLFSEAIASSEETAGCYVLAEALFCWLRDHGDRTTLQHAVTEALSSLGGDRIPLFAELAPLPLRVGAPSVEALTDRLVSLLAPLEWSYEDGELLGALFETHLNPVQRKKHGAFYTPRPIVDYLLDATLPEKHLPLSKGFRVLDPSCGAGNFLSAALEALFERVWTAQTGSEGRYLRLKRVMEHHLYGLDLNPWAIRLAQIRLNFVQLKLVPELKRPLKAHLLGRNTLQDHDARLEAGFDVIVGNPPYGAEISEQDKRFFQRHYRLGNGRQETTALFIERSAKLLKPKGRMGLVVPHGITRTGAYAECRRLLVEDLRLTALLDLGSAFPGVNLETMAFVVEHDQTNRKPGMLPWAPDDRAEVRLDTFRDGELKHVGTQVHGFFRNRATMPIYVEQRNGGWIAKIEATGVPLQDVASIHRGAGISAKEEAIALREDGMPVVRGRDIRRYGGDGGLLRLHPHYPLRDRFRRDQLEAPRIGYQNIASAVVATMLPAGSMPLDTVNVLESLTDWDEGYMLGLLNSRILEAYFQLVIANKAQLTLHLDTPTLGTLPVLLPSPAEQRAIGKEVRKVLDDLSGVSTWELGLTLAANLWETPEAMQAAARDLGLDMESRRKRAAARLAEIDTRIMELYGLTEDEMEAVRAETPHSSRKPPKELAKAAELIIARGLLRLMEKSHVSWEAGDLWRHWARPDAEIWRAAWGGSLDDLPELLGKYGCVLHGRRLAMWQPGLQPV
ncbi:MAG TPA: N-6 DNA methylase [Stenomitos sp.]